MMGLNVRKIFRELACCHYYKRQLKFAWGPNTHHVVDTCKKCGKEKITFKGTKQEYLTWVCRNV